MNTCNECYEPIRPQHTVIIEPLIGSNPACDPYTLCDNCAMCSAPNCPGTRIYHEDRCKECMIEWEWEGMKLDPQHADDGYWTAIEAIREGRVHL